MTASECLSAARLTPPCSQVRGWEQPWRRRSPADLRHPRQPFVVARIDRHTKVTAPSPRIASSAVLQLHGLSHVGRGFSLLCVVSLHGLTTEGAQSFVNFFQNYGSFAVDFFLNLAPCFNPAVCRKWLTFASGDLQLSVWKGYPTPHRIVCHQFLVRSVCINLFCLYMQPHLQSAAAILLVPVFVPGVFFFVCGYSVSIFWFLLLAVSVVFKVIVAGLIICALLSSSGAIIVPQIHFHFPHTFCAFGTVASYPDSGLDDQVLHSSPFCVRSFPCFDMEHVCGNAGIWADLVSEVSRQTHLTRVYYGPSFRTAGWSKRWEHCLLLKYFPHQNQGAQNANGKETMNLVNNAVSAAFGFVSR